MSEVRGGALLASETPVWQSKRSSHWNLGRLPESRLRELTQSCREVLEMRRAAQDSQVTLGTSPKLNSSQWSQGSLLRWTLVLRMQDESGAYNSVALCVIHFRRPGIKESFGAKHPGEYFPGALHSRMAAVNNPCPPAAVCSHFFGLFRSTAAGPELCQRRRRPCQARRAV